MMSSNPTHPFPPLFPPFFLLPCLFFFYPYLSINFCCSSGCHNVCLSVGNVATFDFSFSIFFFFGQHNSWQPCAAIIFSFHIFCSSLSVFFLRPTATTKICCILFSIFHLHFPFVSIHLKYYLPPSLSFLSYSCCVFIFSVYSFQLCFSFPLCFCVCV